MANGHPCAAAEHAGHWLSWRLVTADLYVKRALLVKALRIGFALLVESVVTR
jgi:hypothetical protein